MPVRSKSIATEIAEKNIQNVGTDARPPCKKRTKHTTEGTENTEN
jgi:hypothetical protein